MLYWFHHLYVFICQFFLNLANLSGAPFASLLFHLPAIVLKRQLPFLFAGKIQKLPFKRWTSQWTRLCVYVLYCTKYYCVYLQDAGVSALTMGINGCKGRRQAGGSVNILANEMADSDVNNRHNYGIKSIFAKLALCQERPLILVHLLQP